MLFRSARLVEGLLALARAEGQRPEREVIDLDDEVAHRIEAWTALADEHGVHIVAPGPTALEVLAVRSAVPQVLDNYLANALEVSPVGSSIRVVVETDAEFATVHVIDEGPGLPESDRLRAFDRFWRGPGSTPGSGSGLGLAIVRQLAEAGGGRVALDAASSGGIDATASFPLSTSVRTPRTE